MKAIYVKDKSQEKLFEEAFKEVFENLNSKEKKSSKDSKTIKEFVFTQNTVKIKDTSENIPDEEIIEFGPRLEEINDFNSDEISLLDRDVTTLQFNPKLFDLCKKLGIKIANKRSRRLRIDKQGKPDIRKSIRKNIKHGGVLLELVKSKPRVKRSQHIFLCDVSGSCEWVSSWFFCIIYAAQHTFYRSKFYDFDNKIIETTEALKEDNILDAFAKIRDLRQKNMMVHGISNMYLAFKDFLKKVRIDKKSYIIILSDCRDWAGPRIKNFPMSAKLIHEMCKKSKGVIILNPEPKNKWDVVDSCVSYYREMGAIVKEVRTLRQLAGVIEEL